MKNLTYGQLREMIAEALREANVSGNAGGYTTPKAFGKPFSKKTSRPKRPSHTKMFDFK